jgi:hypothetical protein
MRPKANTSGPIDFLLLQRTDPESDPVINQPSLATVYRDDDGCREFP